MDRNEMLLKEYEFCQKTALSMEAPIWQTGAAMGLGNIGSFLFLMSRGPNDQPAWLLAALIGFFVVSSTWMWWFMSRRWWSIQHAALWRMRHIEEELHLHAARYVDYLDHPGRIPESGLSENEKTDLMNRIPEHQGRGVQAILWYFPWLVTIIWVLYVGYLLTRCPASSA